MKEDRSTRTKDIGGQAVIEGVMMRGARSLVVAVRKPNQEIVVLRQELIPLKERFSPFKLPILRGLATLVESLILGIKALTYSANVAVEEEGKEGSSKGISNFAMAITFLISIVLGIGLFVALATLSPIFQSLTLILIGLTGIGFVILILRFAGR